MTDFSNILGRRAQPRQLRPRLNLAAVSSNPAIVETLGHLAISRRDTLHAFASASELAQLPSGNKPQIVLIGADLPSSEYDAVLRLCHERHADAAIVALLAAEAPLCPSACDFATPTPAVGEEYERMAEKALALVEARRNKRARAEFRQQLSLLLEGRRDGINSLDDSIRRAYVAATMTLFQMLQVKNLVVVRWQRPAAPIGEFSWGLNQRWAGVEMPGLCHALAKALIESRLLLDSRRGSDADPLLQALAGQSVCILPGAKTIDRAGLLWIASRAGHQGFDVAAVETLRFVARATNDSVEQMQALAKDNSLLKKVTNVWQQRRQSPVLAAA